MQVQETVVRKLQDRYDPDKGYELSARLLEGVDREEAESWFKHPCTMSLIASLEGDLAGIVSIWLGGGYSNEEYSDATAQLQAKARGMAQAYQDMIEHINDLRKTGETIEDESQGLPPTG